MKLDSVPLYIGGNWRESTQATTSPVHNPSTGEVIAETPMCTGQEVSEVVEAADRAFPAWWETPATERARVFFRFLALLEENFEDLARTITREHGKTLVESRGDVRR